MMLENPESELARCSWHVESNLSFVQASLLGRRRGEPNESVHRWN